MYVEGDWGRYFAALDYPAARPLLSRTDRAVWWLEDGLVATVWLERGAADLRQLGEFLDDVAHAGLPFAVPRHLAVDVGPEAMAWTLEPELDGQPLAPEVRGPSPQLTAPQLTAPQLTPSLIEVLLDVHGALSEVAPSPGLRRLPVLGEDRALLAGHTGFPDALAALVERRLELSAPLLGPAVRELTELGSAVTAALRDIEDSPEGLVHGRLHTLNVLVDDRRTPTAVVDFGYFSTIGDPVFDAAATTLTADGSGSDAQRNRDLLDTAFSDHFAYAPDRLSLYRLAYALATAGAGDTAGGATGADEHIRRCRDILIGPDADRAFG